MSARARGLLLAALLAGVLACAPQVSAPTSPPPPTAAPPRPAPTAAPSPEAARPSATATPSGKPAPEKPAAPPSAPRPTADTFYAGKTVRIVVGYATGGAYDRISRILAKYMPKHLPGNPTMIVENMPGAGGFIAANHVYNAAPKDGTVIGNFNSLFVIQQLLGEQGIEFDMSKFAWIGSVQDTRVACIANKSSGIQRLDDLLGPSGRELVMGASGAGSQSFVTPAVLKDLGARTKVVTGYDGAATIYLAMERGEVDGTCSTWEAMRVSARRFFEGQPRVNVFIQMGREKARDLPNTPTIFEYVKNDSQRALLTALSGVDEITRPYALPPGVPPERVALVRQAFADTMKDPQFKEEAEKSGDELSPAPGERVEKVIASVMATPKDVLNQLGRLFKG